MAPVVFSKGHQSDGEGLETGPDGRSELVVVGVGGGRRKQNEKKKKKIVSYIEKIRRVLNLA